MTRLRLGLEVPAPGSAHQGLVQLRGWVASPGPSASRVVVKAPAGDFELELGAAREDVARTFGYPVLGCRAFHGQLTAPLTGPALRIEARDDAGREAALVQPCRGEARVQLDFGPGSGSRFRARLTAAPGAPQLAWAEVHRHGLVQGLFRAQGGGLEAALPWPLPGATSFEVGFSSGEIVTVWPDPPPLPGAIDAVVPTAAGLEVRGWALPLPGCPAVVVTARVGACARRDHAVRAHPSSWGLPPGDPLAGRGGFVVRVPVAAAVRDVELTLERSDLADTWARRTIILESSPLREALARVAQALEATERTHGGTPSLLCGTGALEDVRATFPEARVFAPARGRRSGLWDRSVDVAFVEDGMRDEALRVARRVVVLHASGEVEVPERPEAAATPVATVVIPVQGRWDLTETCLTAVFATTAGQPVEVVVVDDASADETPARLTEWAQREPHLRCLRNEQPRGFGASCNRGAAEARGELLVFLNNDTVPWEGWLSALQRTFVEVAGCGAVGGRLLSTDGSLLEAGGAVFRDGSAANLGRGESEPGAPPWDHVRDVDYCSGALLATPRHVFLETGGFDPAFEPAYYEDTDYCFELRRRGWRVMFAPGATVVHHEGGTAGRDPALGVKRHQESHRLVFAARRSAELAHLPESPRSVADAKWSLAARGRSRALLWHPEAPAPDREGGSRRAWHLVELLQDLGFHVSVVAEGSAGQEAGVERLRRRGVSVWRGLADPGAGSDRLVDPASMLARAGFEIAVISTWHAALRVVPVVREASPRTRVIVDSVDLQFRRQQRARSVGVVADASEADECRELAAYARADLVLTVSAEEAAILDRRLGGCVAVRAAPDFDELRPSRVPLGERRGLLFVGNFRHAPNRDALTWLAEAVLPRIDPRVLARHPPFAVGHGVEAVGGWRGITLVGWVPDLEPYLHRARLGLAPLRYGAGTKRKVLQTLLAGTPCVATTVGAEGFGLEPGRHLLVADEAADFAAAVERAATDDGLWERLAAAGGAAARQLGSRAAARRALAAAVRP